MIPVRYPASIVKKMDKVAAALSVDRSTAFREVVKLGLERGRVILLLRRAKGRGTVGRIVGLMAATTRAKAARSAAGRATPADQPTAEIKALHAEEHAEVLLSSLADQLALGNARKIEPATVERNLGPPTRYKLRRTRGRLSADEIKAAVDRATAVSKAKPTT